VYNSSEDSLLLFISPIPVTIEIFHYRFDDYTKGASLEAETTCLQLAFRYNRVSRVW